MAPPATKQALREQCEKIGIVLSARCKEEDFTAALDGYARGFAAGCETAYHQGFRDAGGADDAFIPRNWPEARDKMGHSAARAKYPTLYDEYKRNEREQARRRGNQAR